MSDGDETKNHIKELDAEIARLLEQRKALQAEVDRINAAVWLEHEMRVTLTAEQWAAELAYREEDPAAWTMKNTLNGAYTMADVAALLLYGRPFGLTHEDARVLQRTLEYLNGRVYENLAEAEKETAFIVAGLASLADRIESLLPPEPPSVQPDTNQQPPNQ